MSMTTKNNLIAVTQEFATDDVAPAAAGWSVGQDPEAALFRAAGEIGLFRMEIPNAHGGLGMSFRQKTEAFEVLAGADFGFALSVVNTHNVALRLCLSAPVAIRDRYLEGLVSGRMHACTALTEPGTGSDLAALQTTAVQDEDGWRLSGEKTWLINGRHADLAIVFAQCGAPGDISGIGAFLVDTSVKGVRRYAIDSGFSQTSYGTGGLIFDDVQIAKENLLLAPGTAFKSIMNEINGARIYVAAMCNGMLSAALAEVAAYGATRQVFGKPLDQHANWCDLLTPARAGLDASRVAVHSAIDALETTDDAQLAAAQAKVMAVETCQRTLPDLLHAMGAEGLRPERCLSRHLAASQIAGLTDGATNLLKARIARLEQMSKQVQGD